MEFVNLSNDYGLSSPNWYRLKQFPCEEFEFDILSQLPSGSSVFIIQQFIRGNFNNDIVKLHVVCNALKNYHLHYFAPFLPYTRQKFSPIFACNFVSITTYDQHDEMTNFKNLTMLPTFLEDIDKMTKNPILVAPDKGAVRRLPLAKIIFEKQRPYFTTANDLTFVNGKEVVIVDDIIDTAETIVTVAELLANYTPSRILVYATHGIFSNGAIKRIQNSPINQVVVSNSICPPMDDKIRCLKICLPPEISYFKQ